MKDCYTFKDFIWRCLKGLGYLLIGLIIGSYLDWKMFIIFALLLLIIEQNK
jgi:hypothetical protein